MVSAPGTPTVAVTISAMQEGIAPVDVRAATEPTAPASASDLIEAARGMLDAFEFFDTQRRDWGLSAMEKLVITHLWSQQTSTMTNLAERIGMTSGGATSLIDRLERDGYVERLADPDDRRRQLVSLTSKGRETREMLDLTLDRAARELDPETALDVIDTLRRHFESRAIRLVERVEDPSTPSAAPGEATRASE
jgi:DNA-binding MarR family transcriptional regulator